MRITNVFSHLVYIRNFLIRKPTYKHLTVLFSICFSLTFNSEVVAHTPRLVADVGHTMAVEGVVFTNDGKLLISGSQDGTIKFWDTTTGREMRSIKGHSANILTIAADVAGNILVSGDSAGTIKVWDILTGNELHCFRGSSVSSVTVSRDGGMIAAGLYDHKIKVWETKTWNQLYVLEGHFGNVHSVEFGPDNKFLVSGSADKCIKLWNISTGNEMFTLPGPDIVRSVAVSNDGKTIASGGDDCAVTTWDIVARKQIRSMRLHTSRIEAVVFSPDGSSIASASDDRTITIWNTASGGPVITLKGHTGPVNCVRYSLDGKTIASGSDDLSVSLWDPTSGQERRTLVGNTDGNVNAVDFDFNSNTIATAVESNVHCWSMTSGHQTRLLRHAERVCSLDFSPDGKLLASGSADGKVRIWNVETGQLVRLIDAQARVEAVCFSPDGSRLAGSSNTVVQIWDTATGRELIVFKGVPGSIGEIAFSPDGNDVATGGADTSLIVWNVKSGKQRVFSSSSPNVANNPYVSALAFSPDGHSLASGRSDSTMQIWDLNSGKLFKNFIAHSSWVSAITFSADSKTLISGSWDQTIKIWKTEDGAELSCFIGHLSGVSDVKISPNGKTLVSAGFDNATKLWDVQSKMELASLYSFHESEWAVIDKVGRFDASRGGMKDLYYIVGPEYVELNQLKSRFWDPGLLSKVLGFNKEPLRDVDGFKSLELFPKIDLIKSNPNDNELKIHLTNQGGGLGPVQIKVNGIELASDARPRSIVSTAKESEFQFDLSSAAMIPGKKNVVTATSKNTSETLASRDVSIVWIPKEVLATSTEVDFYAIICGASKYSDESLNLKYPAKDARDMATAITLAANRLFGAKHVHVTILNDADSKNGLPANRVALQKAFEQARIAKPSDILFVYLAGHGKSMRGRQDNYFYLTSNVHKSDLDDSEVLETNAVSSEVLIEWLNRIKALKKVVAFDTCGAGGFANDLSAHRDISSEQARALDRMQDRTGFHVLMGCASDKVSYEANRYGQGLLTFSLLEGLKGAALRDDQYVDVEKLFQYAIDRVPELAVNLGGVQKPLVIAPNGASFDIGLLRKEDLVEIPLAKVKPVILPPRISDKDAESGEDTVGLEDALILVLRNNNFSSRPQGGSDGGGLVFIDARRFPGAVKPSGSYTVVNNKVKVSVWLKRDAVTVGTIEIVGDKNRIDDLAQRLAAGIERKLAVLLVP